MSERSAAGRLDVLESALRGRFRPARERHADVDRLLLQIANDPAARRAAVLAQDPSISRRRLARLFELEVGTTPKRHARLVRFRHLLREVHRAQTVDWPSLALDCGYFDQAHLIRDFRAFSGFSPTEYLAHARDLSNHVPVD
jgi:transcriptional regulator GlxA family with amidase domain